MENLPGAWHFSVPQLSHVAAELHPVPISTMGGPAKALGDRQIRRLKLCTEAAALLGHMPRSLQGCREYYSPNI